jgi:hypothetical protein
MASLSSLKDDKVALGELTPEKSISWPGDYISNEE